MRNGARLASKAWSRSGNWNERKEATTYQPVHALLHIGNLVILRDEHAQDNAGRESDQGARPSHVVSRQRRAGGQTPASFARLVPEGLSSPLALPRSEHRMLRMLQSTAEPALWQLWGSRERERERERERGYFESNDYKSHFKDASDPTPPPHKISALA